MAKLRQTFALWTSTPVPLMVIAMTTAMNLSRVTGTRFDPDQPNVGIDSFRVCRGCGRITILSEVIHIDGKGASRQDIPGQIEIVL
jgi:hypothetical protein